MVSSLAHCCTQSVLMLVYAVARRRVKQICAFTRSIGDCQMKDKGAATVYNTYTTRKVMPRPGVRAKGEEAKTLPYIVNVPDYTEHSEMGDGFLIVACDGVWDEMSSEEAVNIVARLILENASNDNDVRTALPDFTEVANHGTDQRLCTRCLCVAQVAELFIEEVLKKAVVRYVSNEPSDRPLALVVSHTVTRVYGTNSNLVVVASLCLCVRCRCRESYEEEEDLTLDELKHRPPGKAEWSSRSNLHDDITVIILHFVAESSNAEELAEKYTTVVEAATVRTRHFAGSDAIAEAYDFRVRCFVLLTFICGGTRVAAWLVRSERPRASCSAWLGRSLIRLTWMGRDQSRLMN